MISGIRDARGVHPLELGQLRGLAQVLRVFPHAVLFLHVGVVAPVVGIRWGNADETHEIGWRVSAMYAPSAPLCKSLHAYRGPKQPRARSNRPMRPGPVNPSLVFPIPAVPQDEGPG